MIDVLHEPEVKPDSTPVGMLTLAVLAPFGTMAVMASPLILDALRKAIGL